jgi:hypothetical protein
MKTLSSFSEFSLTRLEMKKVMGGACAVCSSGLLGGTCGTYVFGEGEARSLASEFNSNPPEKSGGYFYYAHCI